MQDGVGITNILLDCIGGILRYNSFDPKVHAIKLHLCLPYYLRMHFTTTFFLVLIIFHVVSGRVEPLLLEALAF